MQTGVAHAPPPHPSSQTQYPAASHRPCAPHPPGQSGSSQLSPLHPAAHSHTPGATHTPCAPQPSGHTGTSHVAPCHPGWQEQTPGSVHAPRGLTFEIWEGGLRAYARLKGGGAADPFMGRVLMPQDLREGELPAPARGGRAPADGG